MSFNIYNNKPFFFILDAFESSCISYYYTHLYFFTFIISSSMIYMWINFGVLFSFNTKLILKGISNNMFLNTLRNIFSILYNVIKTYFNYKYNIFFLFLGYVFIYIFLNNFIGLLPFSNTINNHFNITGMISFICWFGIVLIGFKNFSTNLISMFCVTGIPKVLIPFLALIEVLSYIFRFVSLSLRLFANIVAGHILLETIYIFLFKSTIVHNNNNIWSLLIILLPSVFLVMLLLFEMVIVCLQSYIFIVLCLIYLKDSLYLH